MDNLLLPVFIQICPEKDHLELVTVLPLSYAIVLLQKSLKVNQSIIPDAKVNLNWLC